MMIANEQKRRLEEIRVRIKDGFYSDALVVEVIATKILKQLTGRR